MSLTPTPEQFHELTRTIISFSLVPDDVGVGEFARQIWQMVADQVLEAAAAAVTHPPPYGRICRCADTIVAMKGPTAPPPPLRTG